MVAITRVRVMCASPLDALGKSPAKRSTATSRVVLPSYIRTPPAWSRHPGPGRSAARRHRVDQRPVHGVLVQISERWIVEAGAVEHGPVALGQKRHQADVDQLGGVLPQRVRAEE